MGSRQLLALGFSRSTIARMLAAGRLHRIHRGVYAVGHAALGVQGRWMAAVLACHQGAALSHRSAGALHVVGPPGARIEVTVTGRRRVDGLVIHRARRLDPADVTTIDGIPVTTLERTLLDLAGTLHPQRLRDRLEAAERREILDGRRIEAMIARNPGRRGLKPLRAAMAALTGAPPDTRSQLERRFLTLVEQAGLPAPLVNVFVHGELVDCFWPAVPLVVEIDSFHYHRSRRSFEGDRRRDAKLLGQGIPTTRFSDERIAHEPAQVIAELIRLIRQTAA